MKNVIIVGTGGVAAELTSYIENYNKEMGEDHEINILGYLDSEENKAKYWTKYKYKKPIISDVYSYKINKDDYFIIGIADIDFRSKMMSILKQKSAKIIGFIHQSVIIANTAVLGTGNIIYPHCIIGPNASIGNDNLFTSYSFISHDCTVGNNNFFSTAGLSGHVTIGNENYFGIRSVVLPNISIGDKNMVQSGMIVDKDVLNNSTIFHRFKEKVIAVRNPGNNE
jgi:acetyltransferase-like isoleucine patch superfamily enzyme